MTALPPPRHDFGLLIAVSCTALAIALLFAISACSHAESDICITKIEHLDWLSDEASHYIDRADGVWKRGETATVIDVETGACFSASRNGGWSHADWEPATKEDTAIVKEIYSGEWSWDRRSVVVLIVDKAFAASMNGMPHGGNRIKENGYGGHSCIHFLHSRLHVNNKEDKKHQEAVEAAYNAPINTLSEKIETWRAQLREN